MFIPLAGKISAEIAARKLLPKDRTVVEMGNQTYSIDPSTMHDIIDRLEPIAKDCGVNASSLHQLSKKPAGKRPGDTNAPLVGDFFNALGFSSYTAIDINERFGSIIMDLNKDLKTTYNYGKEFDLVTNIGVSEHLFDQAVFFKNAHALTKRNGLMMHILPFEGYVNHGFYNYQPRFFADLAAANGYEMIEFFIGDRHNKMLDLLQWSEIGAYFNPYLNLLGGKTLGNLFVIALMKKVSDGEFVFPLQGKYVADIGSDSFREGYKKQSVAREPIPTKGLFLPRPAPGFTGFLRKVHRTVKRRTLHALEAIQRFILINL